MAESTSLNLSAIQTVVEWTGFTGQKTHLYRRDKEIALEVTLDIIYTASQGQSEPSGLFRLCVPVDLKAAPHEKTTLYLYIQPERVASLLCQQIDDVELPAQEAVDIDTFVRAKLGSRITCLSFTLKNPADMIVPIDQSLVPTKQRPHGEQIDLLMHLAQIVSFSIYLKTPDIDSAHLLREFAGVVTDPSRAVGSATETNRISTLYKGKGGRTLDRSELSTSGPRAMPPLPPSYDNVGVPPPMAPLYQAPVAGSSNSSQSRKRRRNSDIDEASISLASQMAAMHRQFLTEFQAIRSEIRGLRTEIQEVKTEIQAVKTEVQAVGTNFMAEIEAKKTEMQHLEGCTNDHEHRLYDVERGLEETDSRIDVQVDEAILSYKLEVEEEKDAFKTEMTEFVTERLADVEESAADEVEERVMDRLNGATVSVEQARIRLG